MIKKLHHVGIAVNDLNESIALYEGLLGYKRDSVEEAPCQQVMEAVFKVGGDAEIDLLEPTGTPVIRVRSRSRACRSPSLRPCSVRRARRS